VTGRLARRARAAGVAAVLAVAGAVVAGPAGAVDTTAPGSPQGNVTPTLQPATGVAVVARSAPVDGQVALLLQNTTAEPVRIDAVMAVATTADGGLAVRARTKKSYPQVLAPDQLALSAVTFRKKALPLDAVITTKVRSKHVSAKRAQRTLSVSDLVLSPPMTGAVAQTLGATVTNPTRSWKARHPEVGVVCFGEASKPTTFASARVSARRLAPGKTASATVPLRSLCPTYLVAARAP
jgi:hypothetical protein